MNRSEAFDRFKLDDNPVLNQQVNSISTLKLYILIHDGDRFLAFYSQFPYGEFFREALFVSRLQQTGTE